MELYYTGRYRRGHESGEGCEVPIAGGLKMPLVDYLKNARPESRTGPDSVILTMSAPYTKLKCPASFGMIIGKCFEDAGVVIGNRHHGPHALRHSLASNMLEADVPVHDISAVLGHPSGPAKGKVAELQVMLADYYEARGWTAEGDPTDAKFQELRL